MTKKRNLEFVGIIEHIVPGHKSYDYCIHNKHSGSSLCVPNIKFLAEYISWRFGEEFKKKITYEPPKGVDHSGQKRGIRPNRYHKLSVLEQEMFKIEVHSQLHNNKIGLKEISIPYAITSLFN